MSESAPTAQEAYAILNRFEVEVTKEESEAVDTLRYSFNKLQSKAVSTNLILLFSFFLFINLFLAMMSVHRWMGSLVAVSLCALLPTCSMQAFH